MCPWHHSWEQELLWRWKLKNWLFSSLFSNLVQILHIYSLYLPVKHKMSPISTASSEFLLETNHEKGSLALVLAKILWLWHPKHRQHNAKINQWNYIKWRSRLHGERNDQQKKRAIHRLREILAKHISDKGLIPPKYKELVQLYSKKPNNPV